ncbi:hypothetical protein AB0950_25585 [Streptomyces sp. NPDC007189]|uniref:hypothetical protein n=1 Tax=Streptomyces sp. NPDC007189 TaxID=3154315 RepID=UPI003456E167
MAGRCSTRKGRGLAPTTRTSTTSRNDAFSIRVVSVPSPSEVAMGGSAVGRITVRDFQDDFLMDLTYWSVEQYEASWVRALQLLETSNDATSCLISSMTDPASSNFVFCWPLYRCGDVVYIQNSIIFMDQLTEQFNPDDPWRSVEQRSTIDEDGHVISEWQTSIDEVRNFLLNRSAQRQ